LAARARAVLAACMKLQARRTNTICRFLVATRCANRQFKRAPGAGAGDKQGLDSSTHRCPALRRSDRRRRRLHRGRALSWFPKTGSVRIGGMSLIAPLRAPARGAAPAGFKTSF
jgi:hypothetical protein